MPRRADASVVSPRARAHDPADEVFASWLERARSGDGPAWEQLYRWLAPAVAGYLRVQGARDVDDLTSEVFLALVRNIARFDGGPTQFRSFTFVIAHRRLQDERRSRSRRDVRISDSPIDDRTRPALDDSDPTDAAEAALASMAADRVTVLCQCLAADQRDVVLLRILGDLALEQIADMLGKSVGAVKQLQRRAFEHLRRDISTKAVPR